MIDRGREGKEDGARTRPPRMATALLSLAIPSGLARDSVLGDLLEEYQQRRRGGRLGAVIWYWRMVAQVGGAYAWDTLSALPSELWQDAQFARRTFRRTVTLVAVLSLALGIGANAAIYSLFEQMLLQPLPVNDPDQLVNFEVPGPNPGSTSCGQAGGCDEVLSYPMLRDLMRHESTTLSGVAGHVEFGANLALDGRTTNGTGLQVTGSYFPVLGVTPALGRLLSPADDESIGAHRVAVLSHSYWRNELGADPSVLNQVLSVNGEPLTVVGVSARGFEGTTLGIDVDVFVPMTMRGLVNPWFDGWEDRRWYWAYAFARLAPGSTPAMAQAEMSAVYNGIVNETEVSLQTGMTEGEMAQFRAKELVITAGSRGQSRIRENVQAPLLLLFVITTIVLLIACANVANLLLARGAARNQEMAIRGAMGAGRNRLLRQLMTESLLLALAGGLASLLVAHWTLGVLPSILPAETIGTLNVQLDPGVVLFAGIASLGTGFMFGLYPAWQATRASLVTMLKNNSRHSTGARAGAGFRSVLVTAQIALSVTLLVGAGMFIRSLINVSRVDLGLNPENVISFGISPALNGYEPDEVLALLTRVEQRLRAVPGVTAVTAATIPVLSGNSSGSSVSVEGFEWAPGVDPDSRFNRVGPGFYGAMQIPLLAGRDFVESDGPDAPKVAIINEAFALKFGLDPRDAVGRFMAQGAGREDLDVAIVGVVRDAKYSNVKDCVPPTFALPYRQAEGVTRVSFYVRTGKDAADVLSTVPELVQEVDAKLPIEDLQTLAQTVQENIVLDRLIGTLSAAFAALATLLAAVGLYGVLAHAVAQRTREIGVRIALGAERYRVQGMVLGQVSRMVVVGGVVGLAAALLLGQWIESMLFGLNGSDPVVVMLVTIMIAGVTLVAGYLPARRASRVDPMVAIRHE